MPHNRRSILFAACIVIFAFLLSSCGVLFGLQDKECSQSMRDILELTPPASATLLNESCSMGITPTYRSTFTIPPAELESVQSMTGVTEWGSDASKSLRLSDEAAGKTSVVYGEFGDGAFSVEVLIDTSRADLYTVYFYRAFVD